MLLALRGSASAQPAPTPPVEPAAPAAPTPPAPLVPDFLGAPGKGFSARLGDAFSINLRARIQPRYQLHVSPEDSAGARSEDQLVAINTARVWLSGHVYRPEVTWMLQLALAGRDYRDGTVSPIFDAFIDWKGHRDASLRVGQFFVPFDRLRTVREFALQLVDRPRPINELTLDRDVGVIVYSDALGAKTSPVAYRVGVFGGGGTNLVNPKRPGALLLARLELRPLGKIDDDSEGDLARRATPGLALGVGGAANRNTNRVRSTTGPTLTRGTVDYWHAAVDATFKWRGFAAQAEWVWREARDEVVLDAGAASEYARSGSGWIAQASYVFPRPFEIVGRISRMYAKQGTDPRFLSEVRALGQELAVGANYYLNGHALKLQADWIVRTPRELSPSFASTDHTAQVQLDATF